MGNRLRRVTATIANGQTTSGAIDIGEEVVVGLVTPAGLTGASLTFTASDTEGGTYSPVYDQYGTQVTITVSTSRHVTIAPETLLGCRWLKIVSGSAEAGGDDIVVITREVS